MQTTTQREKLLADAPVTERRLELAGVSTTVLEAGSGPPVVLLHGPGAYGASWLSVIPELAATHRVIAPDLAGQGASPVGGAVGRSLDTDRVLTWLDELIEQTCPEPPVLVGQLLGGAIAARFAAEAHRPLRELVLVVPFGLAAFEPTPAFGAALMGFATAPSGDSHDNLWRHCVSDLDDLRSRLGERWEAMRAYNLELAADAELAASQQALMERFVLPAIAPEVLDRIDVPTTLVWGRLDSIVPISVGQAAAGRYRWPLRIIDGVGNEPALEDPHAFVKALAL